MKKIVIIVVTLILLVSCEGNTYLPTNSSVEFNNGITFTETEMNAFDSIKNEAIDILTNDDFSASAVSRNSDFEENSLSEPPRVTKIKALLKAKFGDKYTDYFYEGELIQTAQSRSTVPWIGSGKMIRVADTAGVPWYYFDDYWTEFNSFYIKLPWGTYNWVVTTLRTNALIDGINWTGDLSGSITDEVTPKKTKTYPIYGIYNYRDVSPSVTVEGNLKPGFFPKINGNIVTNNYLYSSAFATNGYFMLTSSTPTPISNYYPNGAISVTTYWAMP